MAQQDAVDEAISDLVAANRILAAEGVLDGFGTSASAIRAIRPAI